MNSKPGQQTPEALKHPKHYMSGLWIPEAHEALDECLQKHLTPAELNYEELEGLSDQRQRDCSQAWSILE